jgi:hypothetical protein
MVLVLPQQRLEAAQIDVLIVGHEERLDLVVELLERRPQIFDDNCVKGKTACIAILSKLIVKFIPSPIFYN